MSEPVIEEERSGLIKLFAHNSVAANLTMVVMLLGGLIAGLQLTAQVFPTLDPGLVTISVPYPGATPSEVEESITRRVEEAIIGVDGIDRVLSTASENMGMITAELKDRVDEIKIRNDIETAIDRLSEFPPLDAEEADIVAAQNVSDVLTLVVSSDRGEKTLREGAEFLEEALLALPQVSLVSMLGARDYEIAIEVSEETLRQYGLTMGEGTSAVRSSSVNLSSGELRTQAGDLLLRTNAKRERGYEFENIVLRAYADGSILRLGDVATIRDGFTDVDLINQYGGRDSLFVRVQKSEAEDILDIAEEVKEMLLGFTAPSGVDVEIWEDQTEILESRLSLLIRNGALGFTLVFLFLVLMLDLRLAFWVAMGVPISFFGAFLFLGYFDVNINMISLFALIICLGVVVDDAVIVGENIIAEREAGLIGPNASIAGVHGVFGPVFIGVLTTMAAFAPLLFVSGTFGQILGQVPIVVITVLAMSLIEVFCILPAHLSHPEGWSQWPLNKIQSVVAGRVQLFRDNILVPAVAVAVRWRYVTLIGAFVLAFLASTLLSTGAVRFIFFPNLEADSISSNLEFPIGTPFESTRIASDRIVSAANKLNEDIGGTSFKSVNVTVGGRISVGGGGPGSSSGARIASHIANIQIQLNPEPLRTLSAAQLERMWREEVGPIAGVESLTFSSGFFGGSSTIEYELSHQDDEFLLSAVEWLKGEYDKIPGMDEILDSSSLGKRQFDIELTPAGEAAGLKPADVARQLRQTFFGDEVHRIQRGRQELKVMVRYPREQRRSTRDLFNTRIRLADGTEAPLSTVARVIESRSYSEIRRVDGRRVVTVSGEVDTAIATPTEVTNQIEANLLPELTLRFPGVQVGQSGFGREQSEDLGSLADTAMVALLVIYALLASQLKSYAQPLVILTAIPFGAAGALVGHFLLGFNLSFISIFGIVALSGVVVNDALVLVDRYNFLRKTSEMSAIEAVVSASRRRFRAILLTTATTALGLTPMLFESSLQAQFLVPFAVSLATGIVFASAIILFLVPALVIVQEDIKHLPSRLRRGLDTKRPQTIGAD